MLNCCICLTFLAVGVIGLCSQSCHVTACMSQYKLLTRNANLPNFALMKDMSVQSQVIAD